MKRIYGAKYYKVGDTDGAIWLHAESNPAWEGFPTYRWNGHDMVPEHIFQRHLEERAKEEGEWKDEQRHEYIRDVHITVAANEGSKAARKSEEESESEHSSRVGSYGGVRGLLHRICNRIRADRGDDGNG